MTYVLGIDGGGTKTAYLLARTDGVIIDNYIGPTIHYMQVGLDGLTIAIEDAVSYFIENNNINLNQIIFCFAGVAGYGDIENDMKFIKDAVAKGLKGIPCCVENDTFNAHAGALAGSDGICVIAGTGSIGLGIINDKHYFSGGWHHAFGGDEGSAHWIAEKYIQEFTKQSDMRSPRTLLYSYMRNNYKFESDSDVLKKFVVEWGYDRTKIASLSKDIYILATKGDKAAISIFEDAAYELSLIYRSIYNQINIDGILYASFIGGVFSSGNYILSPLNDYLRDINITFTKPKFSAVIGSLLLAFKCSNIDITSDIIHNLELDN